MPNLISPSHLLTAQRVRVRDSVNIVDIFQPHKQKAACARTCREGAAPRSASRRLSRSRSARTGSTSHASGTSMFSVRMRPLGSPVNTAAGKPGSDRRPSPAHQRRKSFRLAEGVTQNCRRTTCLLAQERPWVQKAVSRYQCPGKALHSTLLCYQNCRQSRDEQTKHVCPREQT